MILIKMTFLLFTLDENYNNLMSKMCFKESNIYRDNIQHGLKHTYQIWFERFTKAILWLDYKQSQWDHILFFEHTHGGKILYFLSMLTILLLQELILLLLLIDKNFVGNLLNKIFWRYVRYFVLSDFMTLLRTS